MEQPRLVERARDCARRDEMHRSMRADLSQKSLRVERPVRNQRSAGEQTDDRSGHKARESHGRMRRQDRKVRADPRPRRKIKRGCDESLLAVRAGATVLVERDEARRTRALAAHSIFDAIERNR